MVNFLIVEKSGIIKQITVKNYSEPELYKKAGFKTNEGFKKHTTWGISLGNQKYSISLYGKIAGRANQENKYEFPPPVDTVLFFGNCALVNENENGVVEDLSTQEWIAIYENLYGGFEDLDEDDDDEEDDEEDEDEDVPRTKDGYVKDGFVVDDDDDEEEEEDDEEEDEEEDENEDEDDDEVVTKKKRKPVKKPIKNIKKTLANTIVSKQIKIAFEPKPADTNEKYLDCTSELVEEKYV